MLVIGKVRFRRETMKSSVLTRSTALGSILAVHAAFGFWPQMAHADEVVPLQEVVVDAKAAKSDRQPVYAGGQVTRGGSLGLLGSADTFKTPFSQTGYTSETIRNQQAATVAEALTLDPSVRLQTPPGGMLDSYYIRGLPINEGTSGELAFDGVYGIAPNFRVFTDYVDRIEVFKGPSAMLGGMSPNGGVGGVVNVVPKRAEEDLTRIGFGYMSDSQFATHFDIARRFGEAREFGVRVNGSIADGKTALAHQTDQPIVGSAAFDYQGERFRLWSYLYAQREDLNAPTRPFAIAKGVAVPPAANGANNVTQPWEWSHADDLGALLKTEYDLTDNITAFADIGGGRGEVQRFFGLPTILNSRGDISSTPQYYDLQINRLTMDAGLRAKFDTAFVHHAMSVQVSRYRDDQYRALPSGIAYRSNIYSPVILPAQNYTIPNGVPRLSDTTLSGIALADTMSVLDERIALTLGVRRQSVGSHNYSTKTGAVTSAYDKSATTPMAGLLIRPLDFLSVYGNYIEGLSKGDVAPATASNAGEVFAPYRSRQIEAGLKFDFGKIGVTLAAFQILKPNGELNGTTYRVGGEQRIRGAELEMFGAITPDVRVVGGVTVLDGKVTKTANAAIRGKTPISVAPVQASLGGEWDLPGLKNLTLTGTLVYTGRQFVDSANTQVLPNWTRLDVGARYATNLNGHKTTWRASVENVADTRYWAGVASFGTFSQGAPRTYRLSFDMDL